MTKEKPLRSYGRMKGRALKPRRARLMETLLPRIEVPAQGAIDLTELFASSLHPSAEALDEEGPTGTPGLALAPHTAPSKSQDAGGYAFEIGFGGGEHLVAQAQRRPDWRFLGVEPFLNGVASCLRRIDEAGVQNIRLHQGDARDVLSRLPAASLDRIYVLFPDPWPKKRHWKRRLVQKEFLADLSRVLKNGGDVCFATDWKHYAAWTLELFLRDGRFRWTAESVDDWRRPWPGHTATRYEEKQLGDSAAIFLRFARN